MGSKKVIVKASIIGVLLVFIATAGYYFYVQRPADNDYQTAHDNLNSLNSYMASLTPVFASEHPPYFENEQDLNEFFDAIDSYNKTVNQLETSPVTKRGIGSKTVYKDNKSILSEYGKSASDAAKSIRIYYTLTENCGYLRFQSVTTLTDTQYDNCQQALSDIKSAPDTNFKTKFLIPYSQYVIDMVAVMEGESTKKETALLAPRQQLESLYRNTTIDYGLPTSPTEAIQAIIKTVDQEKHAFLR